VDASSLLAGLELRRGSDDPLDAPMSDAAVGARDEVVVGEEAATLRADSWDHMDEAIRWAEFAWEVSSDRPFSICRHDIDC
jgi:hypothetical protein